MRPITDAERRGWQRGAALALDDLLTTHTELPALTWHVGMAGGLVGDCHQSGGEQRRAAWSAWASALGAQRFPEYESASGVVRLRATVSSYGPHRTAIVVLASIWTDDEDVAP